MRGLHATKPNKLINVGSKLKIASILFMKVFILMLLFLPLANAEMPQGFQEIQRVGNDPKIIVIGGSEVLPTNLWAIQRWNAYRQNFMFASPAIQVASIMGQLGDALLLGGLNYSYNPMFVEELKSAITITAPGIAALAGLKPGFLVGGWDHDNISNAWGVLTHNYKEGLTSKDISIKMGGIEAIAILLLSEYKNIFLINSAIEALDKGSQKVFIHAGLSHVRNHTLLDFLKKSGIPHLVVTTRKDDVKIQTAEEQAREYLTKDLVDKNFNEDQFSQVIPDMQEASRAYVESLGLSELSMRPVPKHLQTAPNCRYLL